FSQHPCTHRLPSLPTRRSSDLLHHEKLSGAHAITSGGDPIEAAALRGLLERDPRAVSRIDHRTPALAGRGLLRLSAPTRDEKVGDRKSTRLNSSHGSISYAVFC